MIYTKNQSLGVTIVIPCYNYAHYLPCAIESCLSQEHDALEILVVDDESTDDSVAVARSYGDAVRCLEQKNQGVGAARNYGMREAKNDLVIFLDADDALAAGAVHHLLKAYCEADQEPGVVGGCATVVDWQGRDLDHPTHPPEADSPRRVSLEEAIMLTPFVPTVLASRSFLLSLGGFETDDRVYRGSEDKAMWISVAASDRPVILLGKIVARYRVHGQSMSHNGLRQLQSSQAVLARTQQQLGARVAGRTWKRAWSFSFFQASIIHGDEGRHGSAICHLLRSMWVSPTVTNSTIKGRYGPFFRLKRLVVSLAKWSSLKN